MSLVVAVIPSYRPHEGVLLELLTSLRLQGVPVVIADDASPGAIEVTLAQAVSRGATVIRHETNAGIARSLNDGLSAAVDAGATWLLTVDQDSTLAPDYVARLLGSAAIAAAAFGPHAVGAVGAARIDDASGPIDYPVRYLSGLPYTEELIQSGTLWSVSALSGIGGFDETFGIDAVDAAACVRLRAAGRRLLLAPGLSIGHHVGEGRRVSVLGRTVLASGHSPERRTTIVRNRLRLAPEEFTQSPRHAFTPFAG